MLERKLSSVQLERMVSVRARASRMTHRIFVGHHDRTRAMLCVTKKGVVRGRRTDMERCMGCDDLGRLVWYSVANGGSRDEVDRESRS